MGIWWELYEKYEEELVKLEPFEDDDEALVKKVGSEFKLKDSKNSTETPTKAKKSNVRFPILTYLLYRKSEREKVKKAKSFGLNMLSPL